MRTARSPFRSVAVALVSVAAVAALAACAQEEAEPSAAPTTEDACADIATVTDGTVTVGTSDPAFPPYVIDNDPTNGEGFESAVAYAVAEEMGFTADQVEWTFAGFNKLFAPGEKDYDFALNQISITPERETAVTFSDPYYEAANAILVLKNSEFADATSLAEFQDAKIGVQVATTALAQVENQIAPTQNVAVFDDTTASTQALKNGEIDALVTDLPTTLYLSAVEVPGVVVGQMPQDEAADTWGLVLEKDNPLVGCVNQALATLEESGDLAAITEQWMTEYTEAPVLS